MRGERGKLATPNTTDLFGLYFPEKKRIAHVGFIDAWDDKWLITVEGNTNISGEREGDGVYRKRRMVGSIYRVARYINLPGFRHVNN
jgi:inner membrane protein involved in colicin E2 resistance